MFMFAFLACLAQAKTQKTLWTSNSCFVCRHVCLAASPACFGMFAFLYPEPPPPPPPPVTLSNLTHNFVTYHLSHTKTSHTHTLNTQLCHIPSFTYNNSTHTLSHTISHTHKLNTQLCHIPSFTYDNFTHTNLTHNFVTYHLSHTQT